MSALATFSLMLAMSLVARPATPEHGGGQGWVRPEKSELTRLFGLRFKAQLSEPKFLATNAEEWTRPALSPDGSRLYTGTTAGVLEARAISTGNVIWRKTDLGTIGAAMAEYHGQLVASSGSFLVAFDSQTGDERWRLDLAGGIGGDVVVTGTVAIIPIRPNAVSAVDIASGQQIWRLKRATPEGITMRGQAAPVVDLSLGRVYMGFSDGAVIALSLARGETLWTANVGTAGQQFSDVDATPVLVDGGKSLLVASYSGGLVRLDASSGRVEWRRELPRIIGLVLAGASGIIVASHGDGEALGLYADTGKVRWRYRFRKGSPNEAVSIGRGMVAVGSTHGPLAILEAATGKPLQLIAPGSSGTSVPPAFHDPDLVLLSNKGLLLALRYGEGTGMTE